MITLDLAQRLKEAGIPWSPSDGDRFVVPQPEMRDHVFVVSDMTVEVHEFPTGPEIAFNGTTEWALDSVQKADVVWLPRENQLRDLLGDRFVALEQLDGGYVAVVVGPDGGHRRHADIDAERAYARAVLSLLA